VLHSRQRNNSTSETKISSINTTTEPQQKNSGKQFLYLQQQQQQQRGVQTFGENSSAKLLPTHPLLCCSSSRLSDLLQ
jgi:hypothetical protein